MTRTLVTSGLAIRQVIARSEAPRVIHAQFWVCGGHLDRATPGFPPNRGTVWRFCPPEI
ncbi:hypothetical protein [Pseudotabrizicola sediminis]|nr:hypothetical protein [Pseudotabrizicola sediminis]